MRRSGTAARLTSAPGILFYRAAALHEVGLFDEQLGYGYDNDMSYRLQSAGYRLGVLPRRRSTHRWRESFWGYCVQHGFGYGRLDIVARHFGRITGDTVSPLQMMLHPVVMGIAIVASIAAMVMARSGGPAWQMALVRVARRRAHGRTGDRGGARGPAVSPRDAASVSSFTWLATSPGSPRPPPGPRGGCRDVLYIRRTA